MSDREPGDTAKTIGSAAGFLYLLYGLLIVFLILVFGAGLVLAVL
jgi:hypothetical protein